MGIEICGREKGYEGSEKKGSIFKKTEEQKVLRKNNTSSVGYPENSGGLLIRGSQAESPEHSVIRVPPQEQGSRFCGFFNTNLLLDKLKSLKPIKVLDIGCGYGEFTKQMANYCIHITAIDISKPLIERCKKENSAPNAEYLCMDGRNTSFSDKSFECVYERASLHHMKRWEEALNEMFRISYKYVLVTEPLDDTRSQEKQNLNEAQDLYLELQHEVGFEHYNHLKKETLLDYFISRGIKYECTIDSFDDIIEFDEYFNMFEYFADKTRRKNYWMSRLNEFRMKLNGGKLCANDVINIYCEV